MRRNGSQSNSSKKKSPSRSSQKPKKEKVEKEIKKIVKSAFGMKDKNVKKDKNRPGTSSSSKKGQKKTAVTSVAKNNKNDDKPPDDTAMKEKEFSGESLDSLESDSGNDEVIMISRAQTPPREASPEPADGRNRSSSKVKFSKNVRRAMDVESAGASNETITASPQGSGVVSNVSMMGTTEEEDPTNQSSSAAIQAPKKYGYCSLFRYSTCCEKFVLFIGLLAAILAALCLPAMVREFGRLTNKMVVLSMVQDEMQLYAAGNVSTKHPLTCFTSTSNFSEIQDKTIYQNPKQMIRETIYEFAVNHTLYAIAFTIFSAIYFICWYFPAERQTLRLRMAYFKALLSKDVTWFDQHADKDFVNELLENTQRIRGGIGESIPLAINLIFIFIFSICNAFYHGWKLTLVALVSIPMLIFVSSMVAIADAKRVIKAQETFSEAGSLAEEVFLSIRTVMVYNTQRHELRRFKALLNLSSKGLFVRCFISALCNGLVWLSTYGNYALTFWYGTKLVLEDRACTEVNRPDKYDPGDLVVIFFSVMMGAINVGLALPTWEALNVAKSCGQEILEVIDTKSEIENLSDEGIKKPMKIRGNFVFDNVTFSYPTRPDKIVLSGFSAEIQSGMTVALVGPSGSGKSTLVKLIAKEYNPDSGYIQLDGFDIRSINVGYLRTHVGVVSQTPNLFNMTIEENVRLGKLDASFPQIKAACMSANAHNFVSELRNGYQTSVGFQGGKLSGGQKQRIAIARAILKDPPILILDEPTSALDHQSEEIVQKSLETASKSRTTFIVAHRLNTIVNADIIFVLDHGKVVERGTYKELINQKGMFFNMVSKTETSSRQVVMNRAALGREKKRSIVNQQHEQELYLRNLAASRRTSLSNKYANFDVHNPDPVASKLIAAMVKDGQRRRSMLTSTATNLIRKASLAVNEEEEGNGRGGDENRKPSTSSMDHQHHLDLSSSTQSIDKDWEKMKENDRKEVEKENADNDYSNKQDKKKDPQKSMSTCNAIVLASSSSFLLILIGLIASIPMGATLPVYGFLFGEIIGVLSKNDKNEAFSYSLFLTMSFVVVGSIAALATIIQSLSLSVATYKTVRKIRKRVFGAILRQEMSWFEYPENSVAALSTRLNSDANNMEFVIQTIYGTFMQCGTTVIVSVSYGFYISAYLSAYTVGLVPLIIFLTLLDGILSKFHEDKKTVAFEEVSNLVMEVFKNKSTVMSLQLENFFMDKFEKSLLQPLKSMKCLTFFRCIAFGLGQAGGFWTYSICMYIGGYMIENRGASFPDVIKVGEAMVFGLLTIGPQLSVIPSFIQAVASAKLLVKIIKRSPAIKFDVGGKVHKKCTGKIAFREVDFSFAHEPENLVLQNVNFEIQPGTMVALVGPSGSGKSTCLQLMMRFHDTTNGVVEMDDIGIKQWNCASLRNNMALVEQEPRLFDRTIQENISYGSAFKKETDMNLVIKAAKKADIHTFITSLQEGYETLVGPSGGRLSGGQRQRISLARAFYRDSKILLLDEATSAIDPESEKQILQSLEKARVGKTCVAIAHRLQTIRGADIIFVLDQGQVVEHGNHDELMQIKNGIYANLYKSQQT